MRRLSLTPFVTGLAGLLLVGFGSWILAAEIVRAPAAGPIAKLERGERPEAEALARAEAVLIDTVAIKADSDYLSELGLVRFIRWESQPPEQRDAAQLRQALATLEQALAGSPANPHGWTQLAMARYAAGAEAARVHDALELAALTGPNVQRLHRPRAELVLRLWPGAEQERPYWAEQILRRAFRAQPEQIFDLARAGKRVETLRAVLSDAPDELQTLNRLRGQGG